MNADSEGRVAREMRDVGFVRRRVEDHTPGVWEPFTPGVLGSGVVDGGRVNGAEARIEQNEIVATAPEEYQQYWYGE